MRFTLVTTGSMGDVQPFVALGIHLAKSGHSVLLAGPENARKLARSYGIEFTSIDGDTQARLRSDSTQVRLDSGSSLRFLQHRIQSRRAIALQVNRAAYRACQGAQVVIYRIGGYLAGDSIAEKLGVPCFKAGLVPFTQTHAFPSLYVSPILGLGSTGNWFSYPIADRFLWQFFRKAINTFRQTELNLLPLAPMGDGRNAFSRSIPLLYAFSPALLPRPKDWPEQAIITGHWALTPLEDWQPPVALQRFLDEGPAPIYIGFGSMVSHDARETFQTVCSALEISGQRGVIASGWGGLAEQPQKGQKIFQLDNAPHEWLFPRMSAVIHHGGIGTTINGLKAGLPTIVVPFNYDQPFWGRRVAALGAGPQPIPRKQLTVERLSKAIAVCMSDAQMRQNAAKIGKSLNEEDGAEKAVEAIHNFV